MRKQFKIIILVAMCLAVVGIYLGKNVYFKKEATSPQTRVEGQKENAKAENNNEQATNMPTLLEFSTET